jgi:predicted RecB family nuclease
MDLKYPEFNNTPCQEMGVELFYTVPVKGKKLVKNRKTDRIYYDYINKKSALDACKRCHMIDECLTWALHKEQYGIWGGVDERDRRELRKKLGIRINEPHTRDK